MQLYAIQMMTNNLTSEKELNALKNTIHASTNTEMMTHKKNHLETDEPWVKLETSDEIKSESKYLKVLEIVKI